jgi:hypothetical protein
MSLDYYSKYLKYKTKYISLKQQMGGAPPIPIKNFIGDYNSKAGSNITVDDVKVGYKFDKKIINEMMASICSGKAKNSDSCDNNTTPIQVTLSDGKTTVKINANGSVVA